MASSSAATLANLLAGWAGAVVSRAGTALVGGGVVLQEVTLSNISSPGPH